MTCIFFFVGEDLGSDANDLLQPAETTLIEEQHEPDFNDKDTLELIEVAEKSFVQYASERTGRP